MPKYFFDCNEWKSVIELYRMVVKKLEMKVDIKIFFSDCPRGKKFSC